VGVSETKYGRMADFRVKPLKHANSIWNSCGGPLRMATNFWLDMKLTDLEACSMAVRMSILYKCTQKSLSSSRVRTRRISQPAARLSMSESVKVSFTTSATTCSRSRSFRHFASWTRFAMAPAASCLDFASGFLRFSKTGKIFDSRIAASSGSEGGLTGFTAIGSLRWARALFCREAFPIVILGSQRNFTSARWRSLTGVVNV
jgi:hypothetical protein